VGQGFEPYAGTTEESAQTGWVRGIGKQKRGLRRKKNVGTIRETKKTMLPGGNRLGVVVLKSPQSWEKRRT